MECTDCKHFLSCEAARSGRPCQVFSPADPSQYFVAIDSDVSVTGKTKITLDTCYGKYSVTVPRDDMNIGQIIDDLVKPVLLAAGYNYETVEDYFNE